MLKPKSVGVALAILFITAMVHQQAEAGGHMQMKKLILASVIAKALKPRFIPLPIPIPFKLKINKGEKIVPYPMHSNSYSQDSHFMGGGGGYGMMGGGGGYGMGGGGFGGGGGGYGGGGGGGGGYGGGW